MRKGEIIILVFILVLAIILGLILAVDPDNGTPVTLHNGVTKQTDDLRQSDKISEPLPDSLSRITKKHYGTYVEPGKSTVPNERFMGYHTGTDFEIFESETEKRVPVFAICGGEIIYRRLVAGYGGVVVQDCRIEDQPVTVLYGHLDLDDPKTVTVARKINIGDEVGALGRIGRFTDNERRHLHLGIHKGPDIDLRGYVENEPELSAWLNYLDLIK